MLFRITTLLLAITMIQGCVIAVDTDDWEPGSWASRQHKNVEFVENLTIGRTESSVRAELGEPDFTDSFIRYGETYLVLYYRTRRHERDGVTTKDETTPLVFIDGELVGWGESAVEFATR